MELVKLWKYKMNGIKSIKCFGNDLKLVDLVRTCDQ